MNRITEIVIARGHENVSASNKTTFEITREEHLTPKGDCIIALSADKSLGQLTSEFKETLRRDDAKLTLRISVEGETETVQAMGSSKLILTHPTDMVIRKSDYICSRTLAIHADKAACDLSRTLVKKLKKPSQPVEITLTVET